MNAGVILISIYTDGFTQMSMVNLSSVVLCCLGAHDTEDNRSEATATVLPLI